MDADLPFRPAFPPALAWISEAATLQSTSGNVTMLDYMAQGLCAELAGSLGPDSPLSDGMLDQYTAQVWRLAASMLRTRPAPPEARAAPRDLKPGPRLALPGGGR